MHQLAEQHINASQPRVRVVLDNLDFLMGAATIMHQPSANRYKIGIYADTKTSKKCDL